ncbi:hypothetical protein [Streptomyces botrytidirepellens]|uniref:Secreted protein n=1 Tax=Streptomyces botrytidirepellens TaxID=2486417 RepID=A0A3M8SEP2_9ACTN|nr:hypothetical protein [Streptomyces botrytidirepellens]RNF79175.1 hypothetical protein EEJ42_48140 [Streptomyces botrytidirepellens]
MSVTLIILVAALVAMVALVFARPVRQSSRDGLISRFGPEYDRAVTRHRGDAKAAQWELSERLRRYGELSIRALTPESREQYAARWSGLQERFVESPALSVREADRLLATLAAERGYPAESPEQLLEALSVRHAQAIGGYRQLHTEAERARAGHVDTDRLREALLGAHPLFEELVRAQPHDRALRRRRQRQRHHRPAVLRSS